MAKTANLMIKMSLFQDFRTESTASQSKHVRTKQNNVVGLRSHDVWLKFFRPNPRTVLGLGLHKGVFNQLSQPSNFSAPDN